MNKNLLLIIEKLARAQMNLRLISRSMKNKDLNQACMHAPYDLRN